ncbi:hypothetical protein [Spirosoma jeollabukense]
MNWMTFRENHNTARRGSLNKWLIQGQTGDTVDYTTKNILPMKYKPDKFKPTMDKNQPEYTHDK